MAMTADEQAAFDAAKTAEAAAEAKAKDLESRFTELEAKAKASDEFKADMHKFKEEKAKLEIAKAEEQKKSLIQKEEYKALFEKEEQARKTAETKAEEALSTVDRFIKTSALEAAATKAGVKPEAMTAFKRLTDLDKLEAKKEGNEIKVNGLDDLIKEQQKLHPYLFGNGKGPRFEDGRTTADPGFKELTTDDIVKLKKEKPAEYTAYMQNAQKRQRELAKK